MQIDLEQHNLQRMQRTIAESFHCVPSQSTSAVQDGGCWIVKWVDYSAKYGLGYTLSNGSVGAAYNDSTQMICLDDRRSFYYWSATEDRKKRERSSFQVESPTSAPEPLRKKVTLLKYFQDFLDKHNGEVMEGVDRIVSPSIHVQQWLKTKNAIVFRLSNKDVQVTDHSFVMIDLCRSTSLTTPS